MNAPVTVLLVVAILAVLGLIALGPVRAVREDRGYAAEERGWLEGGRFPAEVERVYRHGRLILTDGARLRELGYELKQRRMVRSEWGRVPEVVWGAVSPPAIAAHDGGGNSDEAARDPTGA
ncbi:MAG: hypothetical protein ACLQGJ_06590 [Candidatus Dormibacteria bacterium]